ncbi:hypothetical protein VNO77_04952 [Canavalia gladiata]|uniref:Uncharacterized protein n=1 Tax=Canavalia gladiata TaxID=3824 RepID=A0AAN9N3Z2_CANGL
MVLVKDVKQCSIFVESFLKVNNFFLNLLVQLESYIYIYIYIHHLPGVGSHRLGLRNNSVLPGVPETDACGHHEMHVGGDFRSDVNLMAANLSYQGSFGSQSIVNALAKELIHGAHHVSELVGFLFLWMLVVRFSKLRNDFPIL